MSEEVKVEQSVPVDDAAAKRAAQVARMAAARAQRGKNPKPKAPAPKVAKPATQADIVQERIDAQHAFVSQQAKQAAETHYWITFNRMGESDQIRDVEIGAAGVRYVIRKGERVPLPYSAIQALKLAVREGLDYGRPIDINGKKYLRKIKESDYSYAIDGTCTPEEAREWNLGIKRAAAKNSDLQMVGDIAGDDLVEVGVA